MATAVPGPRLYRPRRPERTLLYRALADQFEHFLGVYEERFEPTHGYLRHCVEGAVPPGPWDEWLDRPERDIINIERAALLAQGRDEMPPSMIKAIGLG